MRLRPRTPTVRHKRGGGKLIAENPDPGKSLFPQIRIHSRTKNRASRLFLPRGIQIARVVSLVAIAVGLCHPTASQLVSEHVIVSGDIVSGDGNVPLKSIQTSGRMSAGSNQLIFAAPAGFQVGDGIIVEAGGEAGRGARGTVGVGGVWPALSYASVTAMNSDPSHPANTFAWIRDGSGASGTVGDVYQWSGSSWIYTGLDFSYYFNKAIPKALVGYVCTVANGGTTLTLATQTTSCRSHPFNAAVATSGANVYYDNAPVLQEIWGTVNPNFTYVMPSGSYAIGSEIDIGGGSPSTPLNSTIAGQGGYPTCNTTLFSPELLHNREFAAGGLWC